MHEQQATVLSFLSRFFLRNTARQLVEHGIPISKVNGWPVFDSRQKNKFFPFATTHRPVTAGVSQHRVQSIPPAPLLGLERILYTAAHSTQSGTKICILPPRPYTPQG